MTGFVLNRLLHAVIVILGVTLGVLLLTNMLPGGPARAMLGPQATQEAIAMFNATHGFDQPILVQYVSWLGRAVTGDLGTSITLREPVAQLLGDRLGKTALLVGVSLLISLAVAVPLGLHQAANKGKVVDHAVTGVAFFFYSMPLFWLVLIAISVFAVQLRWFPAQAPQGDLLAVLTQPWGLVLPVLCLAIAQIALFSRYARSAAVDSLTEDWVRTAVAKGAPRGYLLRRHVLRNSTLPLVSMLGVTLPWVVGGALIVEVVFNYPGMGLLFWSAAQARDYPVLLGATTVIAIATVLGSLAADLLYGVVDPRIRVAAA